MSAIERGVRVDSRPQCLGAKATHQPDAGQRKRRHHEIDGQVPLVLPPRVTDHAEVVPPQKQQTEGGTSSVSSAVASCSPAEILGQWTKPTRTTRRWSLPKKTTDRGRDELRLVRSASLDNKNANNKNVERDIRQVVPRRVADHAEVVPPF